MSVIKEMIERNAKQSIISSVRYPEKARLAAESIVADICNRGGFKHMWRDIDADIRYEIVETWVKIIDMVFDDSFDVNGLLEERSKELNKLKNAEDN